MRRWPDLLQYQITIAVFQKHLESPAFQSRYLLRPSPHHARLPDRVTSLRPGQTHDRLSLGATGHLSRRLPVLRKAHARDEIQLNQDPNPVNGTASIATTQLATAFAGPWWPVRKPHAREVLPEFLITH